MSESILLVEHKLRYSNSQPLAVKDVVESLLALNKLSVFFLPKALSDLSDADVIAAELFVEGFEEGSFIQKVLVKLVFKDDEEMNKFLDKVREGGRNIYRKLPGEGKPVLKAVAVTAVIGALVTVGAVYAISTKTPGASTSSINIVNSNFVVIGAESYEVSPERFAQVIEATAAVDKKKLAQASAKILAPAKKEEGATVELDGLTEMTVPNSTITEIPDEVDFEPFEIDQPHPDVDIEIRATDLDSSSKGWAAIIRGLVDRRVKLLFSDDVNPEDLAGKFKVRADVEVKFRMSAKSKKMEPVSITVTHIIKD
ncbi:hypothetical protein [Pseudomonas caspiana]|uniref:Uncharacterized protein n=1 Tax=Pseudomonas caspiana TaxID=1451454 RepID=A0A1Y3NVA9_9PSED|nr:hypothetical protein [Pseudomonas caspiana]OUM71477.1 hypothetical protein AUC60_22915 [Pseudomonas caspiana]